MWGLPGLTCFVVGVLGIAPLAIQGNADASILCWLVLLPVQLNRLGMSQDDVVSTHVLGGYTALHLNKQITSDEAACEQAGPV